MKTDMTLIEIDMVKKNIQEFINRLCTLAEKESGKLTESDISFFVRIAKYIVFCKFLQKSLHFGNMTQFLDNIISDSYYLIISFIKKEKRYVFVNERSIIEHNIRMITFTTFGETYVTDSVFKKLYTGKYTLQEKEYALLRNEYKISCDFVHGGKLLHESLSFVLEECLREDALSQKEKNAMYKRIMDILKLFNNMMIAQYPEEINGCFHRRKSLLGYLIGEEAVDFLFQQIYHKI